MLLDAFGANIEENWCNTVSVKHNEQASKEMREKNRQEAQIVCS